MSSRDPFLKLPSELTYLILKDLYLRLPLSRFCVLQRVSHLFKQLHDRILVEREFPKEYYILKAGDKWQETDIEASVFPACDGKTLKASQRSATAVNVTKVNIEPSNDVARINRAFYMIDMPLCRDNFDYKSPAEDLCSFKEYYLHRVYGTEMRPNGEEGGIPLALPFWTHPITNSNPPLEEITIDMSSAYNYDKRPLPTLEQEYALLTVKKLPGATSIAVFDVFVELNAWSRIFYYAYDGVNYSPFRGLRWIHGTTFEIETHDDLYCAD